VLLQLICLTLADAHAQGALRAANFPALARAWLDETDSLARAAISGDRLASVAEAFFTARIGRYAIEACWLRPRTCD
jgi:hypothetical protein